MGQEAAARTEPSGAPSTEALFREHGASVLRWARALGGPGFDADEILQEVFLAVHARRADFRGESSMKTWIYGITANLVRARRRRDRWRRWLRGSADETAGEMPSPAPAAPEEIEKREARERVYRVLSDMSDKYREALVLFELEDQPAEEIARLTGAKVGTVWVWLHRARADFLKRFEALEAQEGSR